VGSPVPATAVTATGSLLRTVWVVNGRPRYHGPDCLIIKGQGAERVPLDQAVDDGFKPCSLCQRDRS
jgi:hypothetical protein